MTDPSREQRLAELDARAHNMRAAIPTRDEPSRYDRLSPLARALVDDYDAIDLAAMLVTAQDAIARVRAIPRLPHSSQQTGELGRAYTRGWESVINALDTALDQPAPIPAATEATGP